MIGHASARCACPCPRCRLADAEHDVAHWCAIIGGYGLTDAALLTAGRALQAAMRRREMSEDAWRASPRCCAACAQLAMKGNEGCGR
jgi:hypothetical protein